VGGGLGVGGGGGFVGGGGGGGGGAPPETLNAPYAASVWVQRAIKMVSGPIAGVDVLFSRKGQKGPASAKAKAGGPTGRKGGNAQVSKDLDEYLDLPEVLNWLRAPMAGLTYADFIEASVGWLKMQECFWLLDDSTLVPFPEARQSYPPVIVARPDRMRHVIENGRLAGWVFTPPGGKPVSLLPEQVIQLKYWNPYDDWRGLGEYAPAAVAAESDWLAGKFGRNLMANNGDLGGIIIAKGGVPTDPQREQIIMDLRAKRQAQLRGELRYTFMTGDIDVKDPKITSVDAAFIGQRLENRHEIALAFGVPPSMFDVKAAYSVGSASDYYRMLTDTCIPCGQKLCAALEQLIGRMTGQVVDVALDWDDHPVMQAVLRERFETVDKLWSKGMPMRDISEYLGLELPRFEGDDIGWLPLNVTPIEQASEPPPEPTTAPEFGELTTESTESTEKPGEGTKEPEAVKSLRKMLAGRVGKARPVRAGTSNHKLWEHHMRQRSGTVKAYENKVGRVVAEFRGKALRQLLAAHGLGQKVISNQYSVSGDQGAVVEKGLTTKGLLDIIFNAKDFGKQVVAATNPVTKAALQTAADQVRGEIGLVDPWEFPPAKALEYIVSRQQAVQGCGDTARNQLNTALEEGFTKGEGLDDLMARVKGVFNSLAKHEARRIAMTETGCAFNFSRHESMTAAGIRYKSWLSSHGPTVRKAHAAAEVEYQANPIPIDEPFVVGGEELMHPGDEDGSPENVINCQCIELAVRGPDEE